MLQAQFWNFSKRKNSTKKPSGEGSIIGVLLKDSTSILHPTLELRGDVEGYNYMLFMNRYYYIRDIRSIANGVWELDCDVDVLSTWIDDVLGQSVYAVMCSYNYDTMIDDVRVCPIGATQVSKTSTDMDIYADSPFTMIAISGGGGIFNGTNIYIAESVSNDFYDNLSDSNWWEQFKDSYFNYNPLDYVGGLWSVPYNPAACHEIVGLTPIKIWDEYYTGAAITSLAPRTHSVTLQLNVGAYSDFRRNSRYVSHMLYIPFCGYKYIPPELLYGKTSITLTYSAECVSGGFVCVAKAGDTYLATFSASLKAPMPLSHQGNNMAQLTAGAAKALVGAITQDPAQIVGGVVESVKSVIAPQPQDTIGMAGSFAGLGLDDNTKATLVTISYDSNVNPATLNSVSGRPCHKVIAINTGFIQASNASVSFGGLDEEIDGFNAYLNSGVYVE